MTAPASGGRPLAWTVASALARGLAVPGFLGPVGWLLLLPAVSWRVHAWEQGARWRSDMLGGVVFWLLAFCFLVHVHPLAPPGAALILSSCWIVEGLLYRVLRRRFSAPGAALLALPLAEYLRMTWFYLAVGGVPWASLGFILAPSPAIALAPFLGEGGLVVLATAFGLIPFALTRARGEGRRIAAVAPLLVLISAGVVAWSPPLPTTEDTLRCLTIQPMIRVEEKHGGLTATAFFKREDALTQRAFAAGEEPDLVIWAETMWPYAAVEPDSSGLMRRPWPNRPVEERAMADLQKEQRLLVRFLLAPAANQPHFLTGAHFYYPVQPEDGPDALSPRNTEFVLFDADGDLLQHFSKHQLVPFGETLPFGGNFPGADWLSRTFQRHFGLRPDFARTANTGPLTEVDGLPRLGGAVCWENVFESTFRMQADAGAQAFLILSNEDWFGLDGLEMEQMVEATRLRAAETGLAILRSTNTGVTCLVLPDGSVASELPPGVEGWWAVDLPLRPAGGWTTAYRAAGWLLLPSWSLVAAIFGAWALARPRSRSQAPVPLDPSGGEG